MNFLNHKVQPSESSDADDAHRVVHREIEITVERTWTSVSAHTQAAESVPTTPSPAAKEPSPLPESVPRIE